MRTNPVDRRSFTAAVTSAAALPVLLAACRPAADAVPQTGSSADAEKEVRAASAAWDEAHNAGDVARLVQLYSENSVSMPYNRPALEGRAAIERDFREFFDAYSAQHKTTIVGLVVNGDWAIERGRYEFSAKPKAKDPPLSETGKHIVVRRKVGGAWKVEWEIWNTDAPSPQ